MNTPHDLEHWMRHALALAARGRGFVEPNPLVGAVVLDDTGELVGEGWHQQFGGPHAEVLALEAAGNRGRGGTLVVTLEPCCHWGKTPPCTDAVLKSGVRRVVVAMGDPFPKVAGGGLHMLLTAGLEIVTPVCGSEARRLNAPYLKLLNAGRPWVHAKWAMTLDGKIATRTGDSKWISGEASRQRVHDLRGRVDAVLVGGGTVRADDPLLTARPPGPRVPARVVVSASGVLPDRCQLRATARESPVMVYTATQNEANLAGWVADGVEVIPLLPTADGEISLEAVLADMGDRRFTNVLVEGGGSLLGGMLGAKAIDEFHVFVTPKLVGGNTALSPVGGGGVGLMADAMRLIEFTHQTSGDDIYLHGFAQGTLPD